MDKLSKTDALAEIDRAARSAITLKYFAAIGLGKKNELERWAGIVFDCCAAHGIHVTRLAGPVVTAPQIGEAVEDILSLREASKDYSDWRKLCEDSGKFGTAAVDTNAVVAQMAKNGVYVRKGTA